MDERILLYMKDLKAPMLSVTTILNDESTCCVKQGRCFMRKVHNLIDKFGEWGKSYREKGGIGGWWRGKWAVKRRNDVGDNRLDVPMEIILRDAIVYDEL